MQNTDSIRHRVVHFRNPSSHVKVLVDFHRTERDEILSRKESGTAVCMKSEW
jgi:hypothetical protein